VPPLARSEWLGVFCGDVDRRPARLNQKTGRAFRPVRFFVSRDRRITGGARWGVTASPDSTNPKMSGVRTIFVLCC